MVLLAASVPHQFCPLLGFALVVAVTGLPAFSRLLPETAAVFPANRLKPMMSGPPVLLGFPEEIPPPLPVRGAVAGNS